MTDAFAELGFPRRPWLDADEIKARHHEIARHAHPDKPGGSHEHLSRVNDARRTLEPHGARLRHLLELEFPGFHAEGSPPFDWELHARVGELSEQVARATGMPSPQAAAASVASPEIENLKLQLGELQSRIVLALQAQETRLREADHAWPDLSPEILRDLAAQHTYYARLESILRAARRILDGDIPLVRHA